MTNNLIVEKPLTRSEFIKMIADDITGNVIGHIKQQYPEAWSGLTPSSRISLKGCMHNSLIFHLKQLEFIAKDIEL